MGARSLLQRGDHHQPGAGGLAGPGPPDPRRGLNRAEAAQYAGHLLVSLPTARERRTRRSFGELLEYLDGHPLAMRLTLPRLDTIGPAELLAGLQGTTPLSVADDPDADRITSLAASITYSFAHLAEQTRRLLPAVSMFQGVADEATLTLFSSVEGVPARFAGVSQQEWAAVLGDAARVGLLTGLGAGIYRIHPALPGYLAAGWHAEDPGGYAQERQECEQALCTACAPFSQVLTTQIESGNAPLAYTIIGLQRRTLGAMLGHALDRRTWGDAERIVRALDRYWDARGLAEEAAAWADRILDATAGHGQTPPGPAQSLWLHTLITQATRQKNAGQPDQAGKTYRHALAYLQDQPETGWTRESISVIYRQLGMTVHMRGRLDEAEDWYRKALTISEELGDRPNTALNYHQLGMTAQYRGRLEEAEDWYRKSLTISEELGDRLHAAGIYHQLGRTAQERGRLKEAEDWYRRALTTFEELGDRLHAAGAYHELGNIAQSRGRLEEAEDWYRKALTISEELGDRPHTAGIYHQLGIAAQLRGRLEEAEDWYRKALTTFEELGDRSGMALTYAQLGHLAEGRGQAPLALEWNIRCVTLFGQFPNPLTRTAPSALARLTRQLGMSVLERAWQQVIGQPVPLAVGDYIASYHDEEPGREP